MDKVSLNIRNLWHFEINQTIDLSYFGHKKCKSKAIMFILVFFFADSILKPICIFSTQALVFYNNNNLKNCCGVYAKSRFVVLFQSPLNATRRSVGLQQ